jgi:hypothetical protein
MVSEWEKQILAYCIRVSRGTVRKGTFKMSLFSENEAQELGGVTVVQLIDIMSYVSRLHKNLKDPIHRRGFKCSIEIGHKVHTLITELGYQLELINKDFPIKDHDGYGNEVKFCFEYDPENSPVIVFEDIDVVELNYDNNTDKILQNYDSNLEFIMQHKFIHEFDFIDDSQEESNRASENSDNIVKNQAKNKTMTSKK